MTEELTQILCCDQPCRYEWTGCQLPFAFSTDRQTGLHLKYAPHPKISHLHLGKLLQSLTNFIGLFMITISVKLFKIFSYRVYLICNDFCFQKRLFFIRELKGMTSLVFFVHYWQYEFITSLSQILTRLFVYGSDGVL